MRDVGTSESTGGWDTAHKHRRQPPQVRVRVRASTPRSPDLYRYPTGHRHELPATLTAGSSASVVNVAAAQRDPLESDARAGFHHPNHAASC